MRILVTGGAGFIGSAVADGLIDAGHSVAILDNLSSGLAENINPAARFYNQDIRDSAVLDVFDKEKPEVVYHLAAQIDVRYSVENPLDDFDINVAGTLNVLEAAAGAGARRFVLASSGGAIYGEVGRATATEESEIRPSSPYGAGKAAGEIYLRCYKEMKGIEPLILRYSNVYGPRQSPSGEAGVVSIFTRAMLRGEDIIIYGDGSQTRDFVFVEDVAAANLLALDSGATGVFNISSGAGVSVNRLFESLKEMTGFSGQPRYAGAREGEILHSRMDAGKASVQMKWSARTSLKTGLARTVEFFKNQQ